ncbi:MAG: hypothetical protein ACI38U_14230 [Corynebacterium sp.]|jgi:hypothetical protein|uniref:hypothetical protein n=1 Tax=Corynebacterium sp. TaxID=1720 RepID=UPI003F0EBD7F
MKRSMKLAAASVAAAVTIGLAAPAANAATIDQGLYPQTGQVYIDPVSAKVLAATPAGDIAGVAGDLVLSTAGPSTTVAVLGTIERVLNKNVREAAAYPNGSVFIRWEIRPDGGVKTAYTVHKG